MQLNINDATNHFSNVKYIPQTVSKTSSKKSLNKILKKISTKKELYDKNENENELINSYENILNKILDPKSSEVNSNHHLKSSNNLAKKKKEITTPERRRKSAANKNFLINDKNLKIPQKSAFYANGKLKVNSHSHIYDLTLSEMSKPSSQFSEAVSISNRNNGIKIFKKVEKVNEMNFEIPTNRNKNYNNLQKKNSLLLVSNQIVNINNKNINNLKDNICEQNKGEEYIQTEPWLMKNICEMKFTINTPKKRSFFCCF